MYVGSLHPNISEEMLQAIFEPFGLIDAILLARDDFGRSKGYGFIQFASADDGKKAMEQLNNFELVQKPIKVSLYVEANDKSLYPGMVNHMITNLDNDELDRTGVNLGPSGKLALMAKLAEGTGLQVPQQTMDALSANGGNGSAPGAPVATQCFLLSNMFDLQEETRKDGTWVQDITDDVITECSKYGGIVHIHVDTESPDGNIYIKCPTIAVATAAMAALNGRFFAGKVIKANYIPISAYHMRFGDAVNCTELLEPSQ
ncbi:RNA-binding 39 isoform X2 [Brachionus plicatilis]|uniref:RNA-binding 39 isoform X2 n=1 Tax=Brachionus plicatilis TaxID=10195 RepID=A0A3M7R6V1_BRAPC|nr:RNA-binding 39 isoform X2 [Brachionus plicatilis]